MHLNNSAERFLGHATRKFMISDVAVEARYSIINCLESYGLDGKEVNSEDYSILTRLARLGACGDERSRKHQQKNIKQTYNLLE